MAPSTLARFGRITALGSAASLIAAELMYFVVGVEKSMEGSAAVLASPLSVFQGMLFLLGGVLLVGALTSLYSRYTASLGSLGLAGFLVAFVGTVLVAGALWDGAFIMPALASEAPRLLESNPPALVNLGFTLSFVLFSLGWLALGLTMFRTRACPRPAAALLMVGAVLAFVPLPFTFIPFGLAVAWVGLTPDSRRMATSSNPLRTTA